MFYLSPCLAQRLCACFGEYSLIDCLVMDYMRSDIQISHASSPASLLGLFAGTCILFGDGCGAVVMTSQEGSCSLLGSSMCSDGLGQKHLKVCTVSNLGLSLVHPEMFSS